MSEETLVEARGDTDVCLCLFVFSIISLSFFSKKKSPFFHFSYFYVDYLFIYFFFTCSF